MPTFNELPIFIASTPTFVLDGIYTVTSNMTKGTYTITNNYDLMFAFSLMVDSDNNGDNFVKVFSSDQGSASSSIKNVISNIWEPFKLIGGTAAATSFDNAIDQNTLNFTNSPSSYKGFSAVRYKENVLQDELAYIYASHAATVWFIGINYR